MRTNARFLPAAAAFLLAASAMIVSGCDNPKSEGTSRDGDQKPDRNFRLSGPKAIAVVTYAPPATTAQMTVAPSTLPDLKLIKLSVTAGETAWWWTPAGPTPTVTSSIHIDPHSWIPTMPFVNPPSYRYGFLMSGPLKPGSGTTGGEHCPDNQGQCYEYTAELWLDADGKTKVKIDPRIQIIQ